MRWSGFYGWPRATWLPVALMLAWSLTSWAAPRQFVIGQEVDVSHLDPHYSTAASDMNVYVNLYDRLVRRDEDLNLAPALAISWMFIDDKIWQFTLRDGVVFHNGAPLTAADVKFSLERAAAENPRTSVYIALHSIEQVEILDRLTVNIITRHPDPLLPARLSSYGMILPQQYFEEVGMEGFRKAPIGSGSLRFVEWRKGEGLVFAANPRYWRAPIPYDQVIYKPYPETPARIAALLAGEVDFVTAVPPDQVTVIERSGMATVEGALDAGFIAFHIKVQKPPLGSKQVRQALHYAIDRETIVNNLWRGRGVVPNDVYPRGYTLGRDQSTTPFAYDPKAAKHLLATAGYKGEAITIELTPGTFDHDVQISETVAMMLREVGINANVQLLEYPLRAQKLRQKAIAGLLLERPTSALLDPDDLFWRVMQPGGLFDYWRHPDWDHLMDESRFLQHPARRDANYRQAAKIFLDEVPMLIILQPEKIFALRKGLHWKARSDAAVMVYDIKPAE